MFRPGRILSFLLFTLFSTLPALAAAQGIQVYGVGDLAVNLQASRATAAGTSANVTVMPAGNGTTFTLASGAWQTSRIGVRGKVQLVDEFSAVYDAGSTVNLTTGSFLTANRWFDRNAFAGISSTTYGTLTFGRQGSAIAEAIWVTDPLRVNNGATNMNIRLAYMAGPGAPILNAFGVAPQSNVNSAALDRQDASLKYTYKNGGLTGMAVYSFGGVAGTVTTNSTAGALLGYDVGPLTMRVAASQFKDAKGISLNAWTAGAVGTWGALKVKATFSENKIDDDATYGALKTDVWALGATYSVLPQLDVTAAYYGATRTQLNAADQRADKLYLVPEWYVTKQFSIYGLVDYEMFNAAGSALDTGTPLQAGTTSSLYLALGLSWVFST